MVTVASEQHVFSKHSWVVLVKKTSPSTCPIRFPLQLVLTQARSAKRMDMLALTRGTGGTSREGIAFAFAVTWVVSLLTVDPSRMW